mmetsp:Transcript_111699/g.216334  ORF Transcript_111699/g.216334 Transcript_111699/m.216334 type:complete len:490 (+) Transcript_111699:95-1564(+)
MGKQAQFVIVTVALFCYMMAVLGIFPAFSQFLVQRRCREMREENCGGDAVTSSASAWLMWCQACVNVPSLFMNAYMGAVSDNYGRRPVLLLVYSVAVIWAGSVVLVEACDLPLALILPFWAFAGLSGGMATALQCSFSIVADLYSAGERGSRFALLSGLAYYGGGILGPILGGQLVKPFGALWSTANEGEFHLVFVVILAIFSAGALITGLFLKESLPVRTEAGRMPCCAGYFESTVGVLRVGLRNRSLMVAIGCFSLLFAEQAGVFGIIPVYAKRTIFSLKAPAIGWLVALQSVTNCITIFGILSPTLAWLERRGRLSTACLVPGAGSMTPREAGVLPEPRLGPIIGGARVGAVLAMLASALYAIVPLHVTGGQFTPGVALFACSAFQGFTVMWDPCLRSLLSFMAEEANEGQGAVLGALGTAQSLVSAAVPFLFNGLYAASANWAPELCFFAGLGCAAFALLLSFWMPPSKPNVIMPTVDPTTNGGF